MKKILFILAAAFLAVPAIVSLAYDRDNMVVVILNNSSLDDSHSEEPVPADCFVDPQTGEVEVVRTDGEGDLYVTVSEEDVPGPSPPRPVANSKASSICNKGART